jgi:hypothetical protein
MLLRIDDEEEGSFSKTQKRTISKGQASKATEPKAKKPSSRHVSDASRMLDDMRVKRADGEARDDPLDHLENAQKFALVAGVDLTGVRSIEQLREGFAVYASLQHVYVL